MTVFVILAVFAALWLLQMVLAFAQAQRFMAVVRELRRLGHTAIGISGRRPRRCRYVALAVGPDDRVTGASVLQGVTVFAAARPVPDLVGLTAADLAFGRRLPALSAGVLAAARQAAATFHPSAPALEPAARRRLPAFRRGGAPVR